MTKPFEGDYVHYLLLIALLLATLACYFLLRPYLQPILMAFILALILHPAHRWIEAKVGRRPNLAAAISCVLLTFIILLPLSLICLAVLHQGLIYSTRFYEWLTTGGGEAFLHSPAVTDTLTRVRTWLPDVSLDSGGLVQSLMNAMSQFARNALNLSARLATEVTGFFVSLMLMLFVLFFALRDHDSIFSALRHAVPLSRSQEDALLAEIMGVAKSALLGSLLTALSQGTAGGFALWLAGFPGLFWGSVMALTSLIPVVGTALVWLPAALYLMVTGDWGWGIFLIIWGVLVVGSIDNFLRPLFMQGTSSMNTVIIFFSLLGGLQAFGLAGLLYGPIIFAVTLVLYRLYEHEFEAFLDYQDRH